MLTPDYASPEQVRGDPVTTATDVYLLGGVLYELLTGRCPHVFRSSAVYEIERVICDVEIERPSTVVQGRTRRELAGDLDNILLTALRKEPGRRYPSAEAFSDDLRRYLTGLPVSARADTIGYRTGKFIRRHALGVIAAGLLAFAIAAGSLSTLWQAQKAEEQRKLAVAARVQAGERMSTPPRKAGRQTESILDCSRMEKRAEARAATTAAA